MFSIDNFIERLLEVLSNLKKGKGVAEFVFNFINDLCPDKKIKPELLECLLNMNFFLNISYPVIQRIAEHILTSDDHNVFVLAVDTETDAVFLSWIERRIRACTIPAATRHSYFCNHYIYDELNNSVYPVPEKGFFFQAETQDYLEAIKMFNASESKVKILACVY